jgi:Arc/MetJ-type ribon-helix-helix transcriptional regulator
MNTKYRAQILLEPEQHASLAAIARRQQRSISEVVREIVRLYLEQQEEVEFWHRQSQAMDRLAAIRSRAADQQGVYPGDLVNEAREEQEQAAGRVWSGGS